MKQPVLLLSVAVFAILSLPALASDQGKTLYMKSCNSCHGDTGEGNILMDRHFRVHIPRLSSAAVAKMSDEQITTVILNGKRKMPPAMAAIPTTLHRSKITPDQVPDLIAFVRTLKRK